MVRVLVAHLFYRSPVLTPWPSITFLPVTFPPCAHALSPFSTHTYHTHVSHTRINRDGGFPVAKDDGYNVGPTGGGTVQMGNLKVV